MFKSKKLLTRISTSNNPHLSQITIWTIHKFNDSPSVNAMEAWGQDQTELAKGREEDDGRAQMRKRKVIKVGLCAIFGIR